MTRRGLFSSLLGIPVGVIGIQAASPLPQETPYEFAGVRFRYVKDEFYRADQIIAFCGGEAFILKNRFGPHSEKRMPGKPERVIAVYFHPKYEIRELSMLAVNSSGTAFQYAPSMAVRMER